MNRDTSSPAPKSLFGWPTDAGPDHTKLTVEPQEVEDHYVKTAKAMASCSRAVYVLAYRVQCAVAFTAWKRSADTSENSAAKLAWIDRREAFMQRHDVSPHVFKQTRRDSARFGRLGVDSSMVAWMIGHAPRCVAYLLSRHDPAQAVETATGTPFRDLLRVWRDAHVAAVGSEPPSAPLPLRKWCEEQVAAQPLPTPEPADPVRLPASSASLPAPLTSPPPSSSSSSDPPAASSSTPAQPAPCRQSQRERPNVDVTEVRKEVGAGQEKRKRAGGGKGGAHEGGGKRPRSDYRSARPFNQPHRGLVDSGRSSLLFSDAPVTARDAAAAVLAYARDGSAPPPGVVIHPHLNGVSRVLYFLMDDATKFDDQLTGDMRARGVVDLRDVTSLSMGCKALRDALVVVRRHVIDTLGLAVPPTASGLVLTPSGSAPQTFHRDTELPYEVAMVQLEDDRPLTEFANAETTDGEQGVDGRYGLTVYPGVEAGSLLLFDATKLHRGPACSHHEADRFVLFWTWPTGPTVARQATVVTYHT